MAPTPIRSTAVGVELTVHVQPNAKTTELAGLHGEALKIRLAAPPVDGKANAELIRFLADLLEVKRGQVEIVAGTSGRSKRVAVAGLHPDVVLQAVKLAQG